MDRLRWICHIKRYNDWPFAMGKCVNAGVEFGFVSAPASDKRLRLGEQDRDATFEPNHIGDLCSTGRRRFSLTDRKVSVEDTTGGRRDRGETDRSNHFSVLVYVFHVAKEVPHAIEQFVDIIGRVIEPAFIECSYETITRTEVAIGIRVDLRE